MKIGYRGKKASTWRPESKSVLPLAICTTFTWSGIVCKGAVVKDHLFGEPAEITFGFLTIIHVLSKRDDNEKVPILRGRNSRRRDKV
jgi:hypothetical protein